MTNFTMSDPTTTPIVHVKDGTVFANSRDVAAYFGKDHFNVLADIRSVASNLSPEISGQWFRETTYEVKVGFGIKQLPAFDMTRDGFTLLVMGYTGAKAMGFKIKYINRFNEMETALKAGPVLPDFTNPAIAARASMTRDRSGFDFPSL